MVAGLLLLGMVGEVFGQTDVPDGYVDMGVRADNGDNLYWAGHDLVLYKDGSVKYAQGAQQGSNIRWKYVADLLGGYYGVEHKRFPMGDFAGDADAHAALFRQSAGRTGRYPGCFAFFKPATENFARHSQNPAKIIDFALTFPYK